MAREWLNDEAVEQEISRLMDSDYVKLAKNERYVRNKRRQCMYNLRCMEKRGKMLEAEGITMDYLRSLDGATPEYSGGQKRG